MNIFWGWAATPAASLIFGFFGFLLLWGTGSHRDINSRVSRQKIAASVMLSATCYTMLIVLIGHFGYKVPLSNIIRDSFGDDRVAWLMAFLVPDVFARYYGLLDPD
jgi:cytosine/uracil/thiamine/allantoin permease